MAVIISETQPAAGVLRDWWEKPSTGAVKYYDGAAWIPLGGSSGGLPVATAAGTADAITADFTPDLTLADKTLCAIIASGANTIINPTFAPDGLAAHTITKQGGAALVVGSIPGALAVCILEYNLANTRWELLNPNSAICDNGATVPAAPVVGQWFLHTPTGRKVLLQYNGSSWIPLASVGNLYVYVHSTGTDSVEFGTATGASAYKTLQYAWSQVPKHLNGCYTYIFLGAEHYDWSVWLTGKENDFLVDCGITIQGTLPAATFSDTAAAGGSAGGGVVHASVVATTDFGAADYRGQLLKFTSGACNGDERVIGFMSDATNTIWLDGSPLTGAPVGCNYSIYDLSSGTVIHGVNSVVNLGTNLRVKYIDWQSTAGLCALAPWGHTQMYIDSCMVHQNGSIYGLWVGGGGGVCSNNTYYYQQTGGKSVIMTEMNGYFEGIGAKVKGSNLAGVPLVQSILSSSVTFWGGSEISDAAIGIDCRENSTARLLMADIATYVHGCDIDASSVGVRAVSSGRLSTQNESTLAEEVIYGKEIDNTTADVNSTNRYSYESGIFDSDEDTYVWTELGGADDDRIYFNTHGSQRAHIDSTGLDVTGDIAVTGTVDGVDISASVIPDYGKQSFVNLLTNGSFEDGDPPTGWTKDSGTTFERSGAGYRIGTYCAALSGGIAPTISQAIADARRYNGRALTLGCWVNCANANETRIAIDEDGVVSYSSYSAGGSVWEWLKVTRTIVGPATTIKAKGVLINGGGSYFDGAIMVEGTVCPAWSDQPVTTATKLDDFATPDDNIDLNANTTNHGLLLKATAPGTADFISVVAIGNGETAYTNKAIFDDTHPADLAAAAAEGDATVAARRDHVHLDPVVAHNVALSSTVHPNTTFANIRLLTSILNTLNTALFRVELDTETVDTGNNFSMAVWSTGTADAGSGAIAIVDAAPSAAFTETMRYAMVTWHDGYGYITTVTDANNLVIVTVNGNNIDVGDTYTIKHCEYTVPTTGVYSISAALCFSNLVVDQRYWCFIYRYTAGAWGAVSTATISAAVASTHTVPTSCIVTLTAGDLITLVGQHVAGVTTVTLPGSAAPLTNIQIVMLFAT